MTTNIYLIKHCDVNYSENSFLRNLSKRGLRQAEALREKFKTLNINRIISSPYLRTINTVEDIAEDKHLKIELVEDFSERKVSKDGVELLEETQKRTIEALENILEDAEDENIIISTHKISLAAILNYFDDEYNFNCFKEVDEPKVIKLSFDGTELLEMKDINVLA